MLRRRRVAVALFLVATAACARVPIALPDPAAPACRAAVEPSGRPATVTIDWQLPPEGDDRMPLAAWCRGVGPAVIAGIPAVTRDDAPGELTVVSWNTFVGGGDLRAFVAALTAGSLTGGRRVGHFVLLLQEVFRAGAGVPVVLPAGAESARRIAESPPAAAREDIVSAARALGLGLYYVPSMRNGAQNVEDRGNAILSTLPLSKLVAVELPFERSRRVAIAATVPLGAIDLRLVSAHFNVLAGPSRLWVFASGVRDSQARALVAAFDDGAPTIVGSDLNTWSDGPHERAVTTLREAFPDAELRRLETTFRFGLRLDYFFFRLGDGWRSDWAVVESTFGSDHRPLVARLERNH
jgi:endonuclease/exonuclease/phosphatase family metal-dependent hydrolase